MSLEDFLFSPALGEEMYARFKENPLALDPHLQDLFNSLGKEPKTADFPRLTPPESQDLQSENCRKNQIEKLFYAFRRRGYLFANVNPLQKPESISISLESLGFSETDRRGFYPTLGLLLEEKALFEEIYARLAACWSGLIGFEFYDDCSQELVDFLIKVVEDPKAKDEFTLEEKSKILEGLSKAAIFETFVHTRYVGQKRFSLEGADTLIPMLEFALQSLMDGGTEEVLLAMAHRGRLNVLSNIVGKSADEIFSEFEEGYLPDQFEGSGDVKYHKGFESRWKGDAGKELLLTLLPNPSHLESVDPVLLGQTRAKQEKYEKGVRFSKVVPICIHGDGALSGQGVVYETLQMKNLTGYKTGGTIHIVINNQIGFTTSPKDLRSTPNCTDIAKAFGVPVFRVSVEEPEAAVFAIKLAIQIRNQFHEDVFIDLMGWRKWGHNESDEPAFTHPLLYKNLKQKASPREQYKEKLKKEGKLEAIMAEGLEEEFKRALHLAKESVVKEAKDLSFCVKKSPSYSPSSISTKVSYDLIVKAVQKLICVPNGFKMHPKVELLMKEREKMVLNRDGKKNIDWGCAEALAYATLLLEGRSVRISGQDVERGTFSHRHLRLFDQNSEEGFSPLHKKEEKEGAFHIYNSHLSEVAALGFEYGYSVQRPQDLIIWEAQFGDFANGAQVIIDQYIASAEEKWGQKSSLVLFLPHGYEGQGPEHSSARIERYLSLAAHNNLRLCNPSTPAQLFHLLRRQQLVPEKKPLILFTPKALLRLPECRSSLEEMTDGHFQECIVDAMHAKTPKSLVICSGKIYYDLKVGQQKFRDQSTVFLCIEQLYPLDENALISIRDQYTMVEKILFVQEEPANMGPWLSLSRPLEEIFQRKILLVSREEAAVTATGHPAFHKYEFKQILAKVFPVLPESLHEIQGYLRA